MKCFICQGKLRSDRKILISADGDFVCSKKCEKEHHARKAYFLDVIIHDDELIEKWWSKGENYPED